MNTENQALSSSESVGDEPNGMMDSGSWLDHGIQAEMPLEALVICDSSECPFMGARSPWANA
jgi:hypothetical protein